MINLVEIIIKQKEQRDESLKKVYVERTRLKECQKYLQSDLVKVITGPRRAGKSVFAFELLKNENFAYLNFDDENLVKIKNYNDILDGLMSVYINPQFFLFDEIQNLPNWELFINRLHRHGYNLIITGSNAKLLSTELATHLTGRYIPIEIFPFSFIEYLKAKEAAGELRNLNTFMQTGGFPEITVKNYDPKEYLGVLMESLLYKDIVKRYKLRFPEKMEDLENCLINNISSPLSYMKLANILGFKSTTTLIMYVNYLEETYLAVTLNRYSHKTTERIKTPKKIYTVDNGYITSLAVKFSPDNGKLFENLILTELLKKGLRPNHDLFYYKTRNNKEIDFIIRKGTAVQTLIQVAYKIEDPYTKKREINALLEAAEELNCSDLIILTMENEEEIKAKGKTVQIIPAYKYLTLR